MPIPIVTTAAALALAASSVAPVPTPAELIVEGSIPAGLGYVLEAGYITSVNDRACQYNNYITGLWDPMDATARLQPTMSVGHHRAAVPLRLPDEATACGWKLKSLAVCATSGAREARACNTLFIAQAGAPPLEPSLVLECDVDQPSCSLPPDHSRGHELAEAATRLELTFVAMKP